VPTRALIQIDIQIAKLREQIANGTSSQTARIELVELEQERRKIIEGMVTGAEAAKQESDSK
jgi:hypothetical protein